MKREVIGHGGIASITVNLVKVSEKRLKKTILNSNRLSKHNNVLVVEKIFFALRKSRAAQERERRATRTREKGPLGPAIL